MTKVLHVGITAPSYSSEAISELFKNIFGSVEYFDWQAHRFNYGVHGMRANLINKTKEYCPDIVFLHFNHNNEVMDIDTHKFLKERAKVITYTEDVREDISWFEKIHSIVDLMIFTNIDDVEMLKSNGINNACYLPVSYNHIWYKKQPKTLKYYGDIVFLGNNYVNTNLEFPQAQQRQEMIAALKKEFGNKFQAYGNGQENPALNPQQAVECYNNAKIAIGHNNFNRKGYQSDRCLNSMGCGCATIMQWYDGIKTDFIKTVYWWNDIDNLILKCKHFFLSDSENTLPYHYIISSYQYDLVTENHTWKQRCESIKQLING